jgi:hypothetical protein
VEKASRSVADLLSPALLFVAAFALQSRSVGRVVIQALDEGVYLYAARLIADGLVPYRDFFLSHPPLLIAGAAAGLGLTGFDVPLFSLLYAARRRALDERFEPVFVEPPHVVLVRRDGPKD